MATEIKMPQLGESVVEGTITKWLKQEGDSVDEDELLVEVSTDKVDSEVPSSAAGTLQKILVPEGETVKVGTPIATIGEGAAAGGEDSGAEPQSQESAAPAGESGARAGAANGRAAAPQAEQQAADEQQDFPRDEGRQAPPQAGASSSDGESAENQGDRAEEAAETQGDRAEEAAAQRQETGGGTAHATPDGDGSKRGIISPLVRRLADENSINLEEVRGSGTGGRIRKQDVLSFVEARKQEAPTAQPAPATTAAAAAPEPAQEPTVVGRRGEERDELVPWTNIRRRTAEHMVASHLETARAWNAVEADWTNVVKLRSAAKDSFRQREGFNLTYMPFLAKVLCETLLEMPEVNSTYDEDRQGNVVKHYVNLGIAVALEGGGLIVPVVKAADEKNLTGLARGINDVATRARTKKLSPDDLAGGTFTITNPGPFGSVISVPIIPRGQAGILGFEAIDKRVVVTDDDSIAIRSRGFLSMSWDHRALDGAEAARFLARLKERVETTDFTPELQHYL
jgi:pyruvate dehydrogenase E2 component (dihydrolipoamide acetyltransferase)